jgi:alpha-beta hydrolase superfamily lysophospholipase
MTKKIVIGIIVLLGVFHIVWYVGSYRYKNQDLPDVRKAKEYQQNYLKRMNINVDTSTMEETDINANGFKIHLTVFPIGKDAPTLVFMPGTTLYSQVYIEFMYGMYQQGFNVVGIDMRGHGMSSGPRGDYSINDLVDDMLAAVKYARERFGGKVAISGSSQGGMVAFYTVARDDSIAAAVCHNLADLNGKDCLVLARLTPARFTLPQFLSPIAEFLANLYKSYSIPVSLYLDLKREKFKDGTDLLKYVSEDPQAVPWITIRALGSQLHTDLAKPVNAIKVPIMMVYSDKDNIFPKQYVEDIYNRLTCKKNSLLLKNTEHMVMTNDTDKVIPPVAAWLKEVMQ